MNFTTSEKIKNARKKAGLSQRELGERLNVSGALIAQYENGSRKPKLDTCRKIASALGIYIGDLIDDWSTISQEEISNDLQNGLPLNELAILQNYRILNEKGQEKAKEQMEMLTKIPEYRKE